MSTPITPSSSPTPSVFPTTLPSGPNNLVPVDYSAPSIASTIQAPPPDPSNPRISIMDYYGSISSAELAQQVTELLAEVNDPQFIKNLMTFAGQEAQYMAEIITLVYQYEALANQFNNDDLQTKANAVNTDLQSYNAETAGDPAAVAEINGAAGDYNSAAGVYQSALTAYQSSLTSFQTAQNTYNTALQTWNTALAGFQNGTVSQSQLQNARGIFNSAANQFNNVDQPAFTAAQNTYTGAEATWTAAEATFTSEVNKYNNYVNTETGALAQLNQDIASYNSAIGGAGGTIASMNAITDQLGLPSLSITGGSIIPPAGLQTYVPPTGPNTLRDATQGVIDQDNTYSGDITGTIGTITSAINAINAGGYTPPLTPPGTILGTIASLPTTNSDGTAGTETVPTAPQPITVNIPTPQDLVTTFLIPRLAVLESLQNQVEQEDLFTKQVTDPSPLEPNPKVSIPGSSAINGGAGTSPLGVANTANTGSSQTSPFLAKVLSRSAYAAYMDYYGVPAGSDLVNQVGSLQTRVLQAAGLTSAAPARDILDNAALNGTQGQAAVNTAVSLGNLQVLSQISGSDELEQALGNIISKDPSLANLTPSQQNALLEGILGEVGSSLNISALNELAVALGTPGLIPQVLAQLAGITEKDPLGSFSSQLFQNVVFAQQLAKSLNISVDQANALIKQAVTKLGASKGSAAGATDASSASADATTAANTEEEQEEADALAKLISDQVIQDGLLQQGITTVNVEQKIQSALNVANQQLQGELSKAGSGQTAAFQASILKSLNQLSFDPVKAEQLAAQIPLGSVTDITALLIAKGLTQDEATQAANAALNAANLQNPAQNPLSSFLLQTVATPTELAASFKAQVVNTLSPAIGVTQAQQVAENFSSLIFLSSNSILGTLQSNQERLNTISDTIHEVKINEIYRDATDKYLNPQIADGSPLKLGMTLLLTGIPGGISNQGLTSSDNTVGPSANQSKHTTSYPGIFG